MKHLIYNHQSFLAAILSLMALCGCAKTEAVTTAPPQDKLYFNVALDGREDQQGIARGYTGDINLATYGFTVAGYRTNGLFSTSNPNSLPFPNVFDYLNPGIAPAVITVKKDASEANTNRQYWTVLPRLPLSNVYNTSYFAWSSSIATSIKAATSTSADNGAPWIDVQVGAANVDQPDIVGAVSMNHNNEYTVSAIDFDFKHLLSKMSFQIKTSNGMTATITGVQCVYGASAVYSEARFTFDGTAEVGAWGDYKTYLNAGAVTPSGWNSPVTTATSAVLGSMTFIPQSLADDALSLNITYTTTQGGATSSEVTRNVPLKALDMKPGKNYIYTLDVDANEIAVFNVKVEGWIEIAGIDKGLPLVPGAMDPNVLLLLEGTDPPYTTADGNRYWLDRSGWNRHCQILDKMHYSGTNSFDITYDASKRGYVFHRDDFDGRLYNHIRIPDLGNVTGDIGCEIVCHNQSTGWGYPTPLSIAQEDKDYSHVIGVGRALLIHINENNKNAWDYANNSDPGYGSGGERVTLTAPVGFNWNKLSFYGYSRINNTQKFCLIDNTNSASAVATNNTTSYPLRHGMIGAAFKGIINYIKIEKNPLSFEEMMEDYAVLAKKYYIQTEQGAYAPKLDGLLACWDARTGLLQGESNGNGAYWMDQSGNNYYLKADVPSGTSPAASITYNASRKAMVFAGPVYDKGFHRGVALINPVSMGKTRVLTFELVYQGDGGDLSYSLQFLNKKGGSENVNCRAFTGTGYGFETSHYLSTNNRIAYHYTQRDATTATMRQHAVATIDYNNKTMKLYINGKLQGLTQPIEMNVPAGQEMDLGYTILGNQSNLGQAFRGDIHAFRVYNRALTLEEIKKNYQKDKSDFNF